MPNAPRGFSTPELLIGLLILGIFFGIGGPVFSELLAQAAIRGACHEVMVLFTRARAEAVFLGTDVGVKWVNSGGDIVFTIYRDGNGNGITTADITSGRDPLLAGPFSMQKKYPAVTFSFLPGFSGTDPNGNPIGLLTDPIRFGSGSICTFTPNGRASPGSIYLSNGLERQSLVRVSPISTRIQIFDWQPGARKWVRRW